jgi:tellurite resistance protein TehA-like permease
MTVMMSGDGAGWPAWGTGLMWIGMIAVLAFLIWLAYALITSANRRPGHDHDTADAAASWTSDWPAERSTPRSISASVA